MVSCKWTQELHNNTRKEELNEIRYCRTSTIVLGTVIAENNDVEREIKERTNKGDGCRYTHNDLLK